MTAKPVCDVCGESYGPSRGGHCRGGAYGGCCRTFSNDGSAARHRVGPFDGGRRCMTEAEMEQSKRPWRLTARGWTDSEEWVGDYLEVAE